MAFARPHFDRGHFRDWTHDQLVSKLIELLNELWAAKNESQRWKELAESREEPYL